LMIPSAAPSSRRPENFCRDPEVGCIIRPSWNLERWSASPAILAVRNVR
jgi:hypothetical protein